MKERGERPLPLATIGSGHHLCVAENRRFLQAATDGCSSTLLMDAGWVARKIETPRGCEVFFSPTVCFCACARLSGTGAGIKVARLGIAHALHGTELRPVNQHSGIDFATAFADKLLYHRSLKPP